MGVRVTWCSLVAHTKFMGQGEQEIRDIFILLVFIRCLLSDMLTGNGGFGVRKTWVLVPAYN